MVESPHSPVSRIRLESLSTDELIKYADSYGVDIPPELERIFIIEEILEAANADIQEPEDQIEVNPSYSEPAPLPKQYNISYVEVIIRDPLWVFVFWEIKLHDKEVHENAKDFKGYFLRVIRLEPPKRGASNEASCGDSGEASRTQSAGSPREGSNPDKKGEEGEKSFTVSISKEDSARYLGFAGETMNNEENEDPAEGKPNKNDSHISNHYIIKLGVIRGDSELLIASSSPFILPTLSGDENTADMSRNPLLRLSGVQDLSIIKNKDRHIRIKRQQ